jgi:hypothetical protein
MKSSLTVNKHSIHEEPLVEGRVHTSEQLANEMR